MLVTGAGSGIGYEMARQFLAEGATVYAADVDPDGAPDGSIRMLTDVTSADAVAAAITRPVTDTGHLDVLCNNAGLSSTTDAINCSPEDWDATFAVNTRGVFLGTKFALPHMLAQQHGAIINTASVGVSPWLVLQRPRRLLRQQRSRHRLHPPGRRPIRRNRRPLQQHLPRHRRLALGRPPAHHSTTTRTSPGPARRPPAHRPPRHLRRSRHRRPLPRLRRRRFHHRHPISSSTADSSCG